MESYEKSQALGWRFYPPKKRKKKFGDLRSFSFFPIFFYRPQVFLFLIDLPISFVQLYFTLSTNFTCLRNCSRDLILYPFLTTKMLRGTVWISRMQILVLKTLESAYDEGVKVNWLLDLEGNYCACLRLQYFEALVC